MSNNGYLNRDEVWTDLDWKHIDAAVLAEVGRVRVAQKVFPSTFVPDGSRAMMANAIPADRFDPKTMQIADGETRPLIEISVEFALSSGQLENEDFLGTGRTLARFAAKLVALTEDTILFQGSTAEIPGQVEVTTLQSAGDGLLGAATANKVVDVPNEDGKPGVYGEETFKAVAKGISELIAAGQPEPYALFLESNIYADTYAPLPDTLVTTADRLIPLLKGGFYGTGTLPAGRGLLVSLPGDPTTIYVAQDAVTAYSQQQNGHGTKFLFRVFERLQFVARDPSSFVLFNFKDPIKVGATAGAALEDQPS